MLSIFTKDQIQFMVDNYKTMSYKDIGEKLGFTERQIRGKLNGMGCKKNRTFNDRYFEKIDSSLKAYFLGFIYADGWVVHNKERRNYEFGIELQASDDYILKKLNEELGGVHTIKYLPPQVNEIYGKKIFGNGSVTLRVYSKKLVEDLMNRGIAVRKTYKGAYPKIPDKYFWDFMRGYMDGNGCYHIDKRNIAAHITAANTIPLDWVQGELRKRNIKSTIYQENELKYRLFVFRREDFITFVNKVYQNSSFHLIRKYKKIKPFLMPRYSEMNTKIKRGKSVEA